jgi:hypothetical protein
MSAPTKLVVEYDDGSAREVAYSQVDGETRHQLAQLGLSPAGDHVGSSKHYLVMQWKDGWQEVVGVDKASVDLLRYYVIERIEERGRLSLETGEDYPELFVIERTPRDLVGVLVVGDGDLKAYTLGASVERWEGIFEAGGKREYVKFDKTSDKYPHEASPETNALDPLLEALRQELEAQKLDAGSLLAAAEPDRVAAYKTLAAGANIRGGYRQEDVYGLVELLMTKLAGAA